MTNLLDPKWGQPDPTHSPLTLSNFLPRESDILITTGAKAGTTWMQQILHQLRSGGDDQFLAIDDVAPWLELPRPELTQGEIQSRYEAMKNPRIFKTHCTYEQTPGIDTVHIILTFRDPRDCCISFFHHLNDMTDEARETHNIPKPENLDNYVEKWLEIGSWYRNVASWWPHREKSNILLLRYEDLVNDLPSGMDTILRFLNWELSVEQKEKAIEYSSFPWMKENADRFIMQRDGKPLFKPGGFIRRGKTGDGKLRLSPEHNKAIVEKAHEILEEVCLEFIKI